MDLAVVAPGSIHDARFLRHTGLSRKIMAGQGLPNKTVILDDYGKIPLVTVGDSTFSRFSWLVKAFNSNTGDEKEKNYSLKLNSPRVVTENAYGVLKSRWMMLNREENVDGW